MLRLRHGLVPAARDLEGVSVEFRRKLLVARPDPAVGLHDEREKRRGIELEHLVERALLGRVVLLRPAGEGEQQPGARIGAARLGHRLEMPPRFGRPALLKRLRAERDQPLRFPIVELHAAS